MKQTIKYKLSVTAEQDGHLRRLGYYATKLYNTDNWQRREAWDKTGKIPDAYAQKKALNKNQWFKLLPSQTAQEVCFVLSQNYKSWYKLRKKDDKANPPMFRKKDMLSTMSFYQQFKMIGNKIKLSMSRRYAKEQGIKYLEMDFANWKPQGSSIAKFCQIIFDKGKWYAHVVYDVAEAIPVLNDKVKAVDLGIINTAVSVDNGGGAVVYSGKQILAIQHYFNKEKSKVTSILTKQYPKRHSSRVLRILQKKQNSQITHALHIHSKGIVQDCTNKGIKTLVCGDVTDIRKDKNIGHVNNQKLHSWSFSKFTQQLEYKCIKAGIRFVRVNEAYSSQECSSCGIRRKSNRKHRGLYVCKSCGIRINADVNGARNILNKYLRDFGISMSRSIGIVAMPLVARIQNVCPC